MSERFGDWLVESGGNELQQRWGKGDVYNGVGSEKKSESDVSIVSSEKVSDYWRLSVSATFSSIIVLLVGMGVYLAYTYIENNYILYLSLIFSLLYFTLKFSIAYYLVKDAKIVKQYVEQLDSPALNKVKQTWSPRARNWGLLVLFTPPVTELGVLTVYLSKRKKSTGEPSISSSDN